MDYKEKWNHIVETYNSNMYAKEEIIQNTWKLLFSFIFGYSLENIITEQNVQMGCSTKRADILISKQNEDLFVVELKQQTFHEGQEQLFSYLNQLKINTGLLICDKLYIYDFDYTQKGNNYSVLEITFIKDNPDGERFVELFANENFNRDNIKCFIETKNESDLVQKQIEKELTAELIIDLIESYLSKKYHAEDVKAVLERKKIAIEEKTSQIFNIGASAPITPGPKITMTAQKDNTQFKVNGTPTGGKCPTVYAAIKYYIDNNPGINIHQLQTVFPDNAARPGFAKMIRRVEDVTQKEWADHRFNKHCFELNSGDKVVVSTQWKPDNFASFIKYAGKAGIIIEPL